MLQRTNKKQETVWATAPTPAPPDVPAKLLMASGTATVPETSSCLYPEFQVLLPCEELLRLSNPAL